jgi:hypothetical protein
MKRALTEHGNQVDGRAGEADRGRGLQHGKNGATLNTELRIRRRGGEGIVLPQESRGAGSDSKLSALNLSVVAALDTGLDEGEGGVEGDVAESGSEKDLALSAVGEVWTSRSGSDLAAGLGEELTLVDEEDLGGTWVVDEESSGGEVAVAAVHGEEEEAGVERAGR